MKGPHQGQPVRTAGAPLTRARGAMVMLHGRGATAESILSLAQALDAPDFAYLAPQAGGNSWWPQSFLAPIANNEPGISSAMEAVEETLRQTAAAGIPPERTLLLGFSQGACLAAEFAARHARRYGGVAALSGGLIGPDGTPRTYPGSLEGTPVFLGCSDIDPHIPVRRVRESDEVLRTLGGEVTMRLYPGMGHLINEDEINAVQGMMETVELNPSGSSE
ncbi:MAG: alpha/beta hydrolase [Gemmatimonadales bacterium]